MPSLADNLEPPYYAAIVENQPHHSAEEPASVADRLVSLAVRRPGFLGLETARTEDGRSITVAYWKELTDVEGWKHEDAPGEQPFPVEVRHISKPGDITAPNAFSVDATERSVWRYT